MTTRIQGITLFHLKQAFLDAMISFQHSESLIVSDNLYVRILLTQQTDTSRMIRLHMIYHEIIQRTSVQGIHYFFQENIRVTNIDRIDQYGFLVYDQVRVIGNAVWQRPHILEEGLLTVINSYIINFIRNFF